MKHSAQVGERWGYRERPRTPADPVRPVEVLQRGPNDANRVRVKWLSGEYQGMDQWVPLTRLVSPWPEAQDLVADERRLLELCDHAENLDQLEWDAAQHVLDHLRMNEVVGLGYQKYRGVVFLEPDDVPLQYLGLRCEDLLDRYPGFIDREGEYYGSWQVGLELTRAIAGHHRDDLVRALRAERRRDKERAVGGSAASTDPRESAAASATAAEKRPTLEQLHRVILGWIGAPDAVDEWDELEALHREVARLRHVLAQTADWLRWKGFEERADLLQRQAFPR